MVRIAALVAILIAPRMALASALPDPGGPPTGGPGVDSIAGMTRANSGGSFTVRADLEGRPIRRVEIVTRDLYDPLPRGGPRGLYTLANRLHVKTRESTVRGRLLVSRGQLWSADFGRETARALRSSAIFEPTHLEALSDGDSVAVRVETRDFWTTTPEFVLEGGGGKVYGTLGLLERNLAGLGKSILFSYREDPAGVRRSIGYSDPDVLGSRLQLGVTAGNGTDGASQSLTMEVPFYAEDTPYAYGFTWAKATSLARLFAAGSEAASFDRRKEETEVHWGRGRRVPRGILRLEASFLVRDQRFGPTQLEPGAPPEFAGVEENLHIRRLGGQARLWRPHFIERTVVENLEGVEDFDVGTSLSLQAGVSPEFLGSSENEGYLRGGVDAGITVGDRHFGWARLDGSTRLRDKPVESLLKVRARWVTQLFPNQALVLAAQGAAGQEMPRDFQVIFGGLNGLRAFSVHELSGTEAWRLNAENRWVLGRDYFHVLSLGTAAFYDAGRAWGPGSSGGWRQGAGVGLRISLPHFAHERVARLDVAWPISQTRDGRRETVFSFGSSQAF